MEASNQFVELSARLAAAQARYKVALDELIALRKQYANLVCPFKVGDVVPCCDYSYTGRPLVVEEVVFSPGAENSNSWQVRGFVRHRNGKRGKYRQAFTEKQWLREGAPAAICTATSGEQQ